jgi:hypothetical protein
MLLGLEVVGEGLEELALGLVLPLCLGMKVSPFAIVGPRVGLTLLARLSLLAPTLVPRVPLIGHPRAPLVEALCSGCEDLLLGLELRLRCVEVAPLSTL